MDSIQFNKDSLASIEVFQTMQECAQQTAKYIITGNIGFSGGSTYKQMCTAWSKLPLHFQSPSFYPVDERVVPFEDSESNWGAIYALFLKSLGFEDQKSHFAVSAKQYEQLLIKNFNTQNPIFDTLFLGIGFDDGHTASLFPNGKYLNGSNDIVLSTISPKPPFQRITLSPKTIINAKKVILIIQGKNKVNIVKELFNKNNNLPIVQILSQRKKSNIFMEKNLLEFS